ncbi:MAG: SxtJ family membrane protein [Alphaproteobacteria bacterium]|jgi:predicted membrane metal-binding protein|nr:SxtJ family membrane protein [Alphaproteobacteria bacterium]
MRPGSERAFGLVFAAVFALIGLWPLLGNGSIRLWALAIAALILGLALLLPRALAPANRAWHRLGLLMHRVMTPLVMSVIFFVTVTPMAVLMRLLGKDPLRLRREPEAQSYWIPREPPGPEPDSMKNQF